MRFDIILDLLKKYSVFAIIVVLSLTILFLFGYFVIYKRLMHGKKEFNKKSVLLAVIGLFYLLVVFCAVFMNRNNVTDYSVQHLFSSYKSAWYTCSAQAWRNIVLNILLFVPFGILLPLLSQKTNKPYFVIPIGAASSLIIEAIQYIFKIGVFEFDDVLNNTVGVILGYCVYRLFSAIRNKAVTPKKVIICLLPFLIVTGTFSGIYVAYQIQPYGNLYVSDYEKHNMKNTKIICDTAISDKSTTKNIYRAKEYTVSDAIKQSKCYFQKGNIEVDYKSYVIENDTLKLNSVDGKYHFSMDLTNGTYNFHNEDLFQVYTNETPDISYTEDEVRNILKEYSVFPPVNSELTVNENSYYEFSHTVSENDKSFCNGTIYCYLFDGDVLGQIDNNMVDLDKCATENIMSEKEVINLIKQGKFYSGGYDFENSTIQINSIELTYINDSKNYYQPIYYTKASLKNSKIQEIELFIPALKK